MTLISSNIQTEKASNDYSLTPYTESLLAPWENMVAASLTGTFLHTRKFLSYHGNKFNDQSILIYDTNNILRAVFPAAQDPSDKSVVISHPGITYGGLLHDGWLYGQRAIDALTQIIEYYASAGFKEMIYKAMPAMYHRSPAQDDIYALFKLKAERYRVDLSTTIDITKRLPPSDRRNRSLKKAIKGNLTISEDFNMIDSYWQILANNLKDKHEKTPVHSLPELYTLKERFPDHIELITVFDQKELLAGSLLFYCPTLVHAQYFASTARGREMGALDMVIEHSIEKTKKAGKRYYDFGISTDKQGSYLNNTLYTYKSEFGACGSAYEFYKIKL